MFYVLHLKAETLFLPCMELAGLTEFPLKPRTSVESTHPVFGVGSLYPPGLHHSFASLGHRGKPGPQAFRLSSLAATHKQ